MGRGIGDGSVEKKLKHAAKKKQGLEGDNRYARQSKLLNLLTISRVGFPDLHCGHQ
jgi:hypothetical protein